MLKRILENYEANINCSLHKLFNEAPVIEVSKNSPIVIFSDLHMGNGKSNDDFKKNAGLFSTALEKYYLEKDYALILNGDIEELQKFSLNSIRSCWAETFKLFDSFYFVEKLIKLAGNHDEAIFNENNDRRFREQRAVRIRIKQIDIPLFVFHGHQASVYYKYLNRLNTILLRYIVNPLKIKNFAKNFKHKKKMRIENRSYNYSRANKMISIIGHTHRPLFESLSRSESLHFSIENLLRTYREAKTDDKRSIAAEIRNLKRKYDQCVTSQHELEPASLMYSRGIPVPCLFNTGCTIGKRGITGIEITEESIALVHWFDSRVSSRFLFDQDYKAEALSEDSTIFRVVLREDKLSYIADTINLLGGRSGGSESDNSDIKLIKTAGDLSKSTTGSEETGKLKISG